MGIYNTLLARCNLIFPRLQANFPKRSMVLPDVKAFKWHSQGSKATFGSGLMAQLNVNLLLSENTWAVVIAALDVLAFDMLVFNVIHALSCGMRCIYLMAFFTLTLSPETRSTICFLSSHNRIYTLTRQNQSTGHGIKSQW